MTSKRFKFLSTDEFNKLSQREKVSYLSRAAAALGKTLGMGAVQRFEPERPAASPGTLGAVLYADPSKATISEQDWVDLVQSAAAGNQLALYRLYERTHRIVFTLIMRIVGDRQTAEDLTLGVYQDIWRHALRFDAEDDTVLGWIMNFARSIAMDQLRLAPRSDRAQPRAKDLRPAASLQRRLARSIAAETGREPVLPTATAPQWSEPEWENVAPGISCKLLATDTRKHRISMLVRLVPGGEYPPHTHAGREELHLLEGELWIDDRKLYPGDYNRAEVGTGDKRVWSETGCSCVLITSTKDMLS